MTDSVTSSPKKRRGLFSRSRQNPIMQKELRSRMRGRRAFVTLTVYLVVMSGFILLIYSSFTGVTGPSNFTLQSRGAGRAVFTSVAAIQTFMAAFIGPAFTSGAISGEKERQTYDLLRTTLLPARAVVSGKLLSALSYVMLLIAASLPLHGIALLLGGVDLIEFAISQLLIVVASITFALWGMYISSVMRSTISATVVTFAGSLALLLGFPFIFTIVSAFGAAFLFSGSAITTPALIGAYLLAFLAATNLPMTMIFSEFAYLEEGSLWFVDVPLSGSGTYTFPSLWWVFVIIYLLTALFFYWRCIVNVRYIPRR